MSSTGAGYDYSCGTFSPDGRIFQLEYASKAVENSGTAIGIRCSDGVVMAVEKPQVSKMLVAGSNRRMFGVTPRAGIAVTGFVADGRQVVNRARDEARSYKDIYGHDIVPSVLSNRLANYVHYFTTHGALRPFGCASMIAAFDEDVKSHELYMVEPSGLCFRYFGCAAGKGANAAKTEVEKLLQRAGSNGTEITCVEAVKELARIMYVVRDSSRDKPFELEMGWLSEATDWKYTAVPSDVVSSADTAGKAAAIAQVDGGSGGDEESKGNSMEIS